MTLPDDGLAERLRRALRSANLALTRLSDGTGVLLDMEGLEVLSLNATAMFVVDRLAVSEEDFDAIARGLAVRFRVGADEAACDVERFLKELTKALAA